MKNLFKKIFSKKRFEYLYFYLIDTNFISSNNTQEKICELVNKDLKFYKKKIIDIDFFTDKENYFQSLMLLSTSMINNNAFLNPLIYEIYAYIKKDFNEKIFSYKYDKLIYEYNLLKETKSINIFKFKIEC